MFYVSISVSEAFEGYEGYDVIEISSWYMCICRINARCPFFFQFWLVKEICLRKFDQRRFYYIVEREHFEVRALTRILDDFLQADGFLESRSVRMAVKVTTDLASSTHALWAIEGWVEPGLLLSRGVEEVCTRAMLVGYAGPTFKLSWKENRTVSMFKL